MRAGSGEREEFFRNPKVKRREKKEKRKGRDLEGEAVNVLEVNDNAVHELDGEVGHLFPVLRRQIITQALDALRGKGVIIGITELPIFTIWRK